MPPAAPQRDVPVPASLATVAARVEVRLAELFAAEVERWDAVDPDVTEPLRFLEQFVLSGGKRLRPAFCHWAFVGLGGDPDDPAVVDAGAAFELLQAFALVHDDVMDGSATRRGERTVHLAYADLHDDRSWRGEQRRFGEGIAILVGDLAHVYADRLMSGVSPTAAAVWHELRVELNVGQLLDVLGTARRDTGLDLARRIARYKSGKYTIERPLHVGAALAGDDGGSFAALSAFGDPLGEAFQLRDDLLGAFGDQRRTGKPVGDDLREGKPTPLLSIATSRANTEEAEVLALVGSEELTPADVEAIQEVLVATGAAAEVEASIDRLAGEAIEAVERLPLSTTACDELVALARYVAWRDR